jgi:hypothetical protein
MQPREEHDLHARLADLDSFDRLVALLASVLEQERGAVRQCDWLLRLLEVMAKRLPEYERLILASQLINAAMRLVCRWH